MFQFKKVKNFGVGGLPITAPGDTNPSDATGVGYWALKKLCSFSPEHLW